MKIFSTLFTLCAAFTLAAFTVVVPDNARSYDDFAASELVSHLGKISGRKITTVAEKDYKGSKPVIFLGNTRKGKDAAKDFRNPEEWRIFSAEADTLVLAGSDPKGMLHGIYEFLERFGNVRWFDEYNTFIPENKNFKLPSGIDIKGRPYFRVRHIYDSLDYLRKSQIFKIRNKGQSYGTVDIADYSLLGSPAPHHTFHRYSAKFKNPKPEMFALGKNNKRVMGPKGQLCMTNPETRRQVLAILREFIKSDRAKAARNNVPPPVIYDISHNDSVGDDYCRCADCKAIADREGGVQSAPLLDFINYIAAEIGREYPEIFIRTFAYIYSYEPPKNIKAAKNVIIHIALLGTEFGQNGKRDTLSALNTPQNSEAMRLIREWGKRCQNIAVWDYWKLWGTRYQAAHDPYINVYPLIYNMSVYKNNNVTGIFVECESPAMTSFFGLKRYIGFRLMDDPQRDAEKEIDAFMQGMYAEAAPIMKEYLDLLSEMQKKNNLVLGLTAPASRADFDRKFYAKVMSMLTRARDIAAKDKNPLIKANVEREFIPVIASWFMRYPSLGEGQNDFDYSKMLADYKKFGAEALDYYFTGEKAASISAASRKVYTTSLEMFRNNREYVNIPLPDKLKGKDVIVLPYFRFRNASNAKILKDPDSQFGSVIALGKESPKKSSGNITSFGIYDVFSAKLLRATGARTATLPQDEKYHLLHIGKATLSNVSTYFYATNTWVIQCVLDMLYNVNMSEDYNTYDFYVSVKFSGPDYVKNSKQTESIVAVEALYAVRTVQK